MHAKVILYIAQSLNGHIARKDGSLDWLPQFSQDGEDYGYKKMYDEITTVVMGNTTYKQIQTFGSFPYPNKKCFVFSKSQKGNDKHVSFTNQTIKQFLQKNTNETIWLVGGSKLIESFIKENAIDEYIITTIPIIIKDGIPLFKNVIKDCSLQLKSQSAFKSGLVQTTYIKK